MHIKYNSIVTNTPEFANLLREKNQSNGRLSSYLQNIGAVIVHGFINWPRD